MSKKYRENLINFPQLQISNSSESGKKLLEVFDNLEVNKASINKRVIEAWFDTDCEETKEMLEWFSEFINNDNALSAYENYKYKGICQLNTIHNDKDYNSALSELMHSKPGILNYDDNCFENEYLEDDLEMVLNEQQHLDQVLQLHERLAAKITTELNKLESEELTYCLKKKKALEKCIEFGVEIEETNKKLHSQINYFAQQLHQYQTNTSNITTLYPDNANIFYDLPSVDIFFKRELNAIHNLNVTTKSARKRLLNNSNFDSVNEFEVLINRINKSIANYVQMEVAWKMSFTETQFLANLNINDVRRILSSQSAIESNIACHELAIKNGFDDLEALARKIAKSHVNKPKLDALQNIKQLKQQKLERYEETHSKVAQILASCVLVFLLLKREENNTEMINKFLKSCYRYTTTILHTCQLKIEEILEVVNDYSLSNQKPFEEKLEIFKFQKNILLGDNNRDSTSLLDLMKNFTSEQKNINQQIFSLELNNRQSITKNFEKDITDRKTVLGNGPTSQIDVIPGSIYNYFEQINEAVIACAASVKLSIQLMNDTEKKLPRTKWLKIGRQLWMWFIADPSKLIATIKEIELASNQKKN